MSEPHRHPFSYGPFASSSDFQEDDPALNDWTVHRFTQPLGIQVNSLEAIPGYSENPATQSPIITDNRNSKVAIPRSATSHQFTSSGRVSRACENCREQKAKCSGHRPCQRCQEAGINCSYGDRKREKMVKQLGDLANQVQAYEAVFRDIFPKLDAQTAQHVETLLNDLNEQPTGNNSQLLRSLRASTSSPIMMTEPVHSGSIVNNPGSSLGAVDYTDEDFNRDEKAQALGFVGEHSEIAWLYKLKREIEQDQLSYSKSPRDNLDRHSLASMNFFADNTAVFVINDVDLSQRPPESIADRLVDTYFETVHPCFPVIVKMMFLHQYKNFYSKSDARPGRKWLAILNLVFAIAARFSFFVQDSTEPLQEDHMVYFSRALKLSLGNAALLDHPNLQQVQVEGLASFYLLSVGQINRSWRMCGTSIRSAVTMGLNLRSESNAIAPTSKEARYRVWWSLYGLDNTLCMMTGRPPSSSDGFCTTPLPVPFNEEEYQDSATPVAQLIADHEARNTFMGTLLSKGLEQSLREHTFIPGISELQVPSPGKQCEHVAASALKSLTPNISLYFLHLTDLTLIMRDAVDKLYAPGAARKSWNDIEMTTSTLNSKADSWLSNLPSLFQFTQDDETGQFQRQRLSLAFCFYSAKIVISQPCFRRSTRKNWESGMLGGFSSSMATLCLESAGRMLKLLPDQPDILWLYNLSPWSHILHYLMQCTTILLSELFNNVQLGTAEYERVLQMAKKATAWLYEMSAKDHSAQRAWLVCKELFLSHASELSDEVSSAS